VARVPQRDHGHALVLCLGNAQLHRLLAHHLSEAELPVNHGNHIVLEHDLRRLIGEYLSGAKPFDIGRDADDPVRVMSDKVGLDQVVRDPRVLRRPATSGGEEGADEALEPVMRDDQGVLPSSKNSPVAARRFRNHARPPGPDRPGRRLYHLDIRAGRLILQKRSGS
jgi:hypothetical protein